jgi:ricin-type beta-trefoil lectin protein
LINRGSGKAVDVKAGSTTDGAVVQQSTPSDVFQQQYQIVAVP